MRTRYKILLAASLVVAVPFAVLFVFPIVFMAAGSAVASHIISSTADAEFEEDFAATIPEVGLFVGRHPEHATSHGGDFLGWKVILYKEDQAAGPGSMGLFAKKSVLHHGTVVRAGCYGENGSLTYDIPGEQVARYIEGGLCARGR